MPLYSFRCDACGATAEKLCAMTKLRVTYRPDGTSEVLEGDDTLTAPTIPCECGEHMKRVPSRSRAYLRDDATQSCGWSRPGMSDVNYSNGPDGLPASFTHSL